MSGFLYFLLTLHFYLFSDSACIFQRKTASRITATAPGIPIIPVQTAVMGFIPAQIPYFSINTLKIERKTQPAMLFKTNFIIYFLGAEQTKNEQKIISTPREKPTIVIKFSKKIHRPNNTQMAILNRYLHL